MSWQNLPVNPFVGLRHFESHESILFFGRASQTLELLDKLHETHFLAVIGSSGSGKSSLIRAGLIPKLEAGFLVAERDRWLVVTLKPGEIPIKNLATSFSAILRDEQLKEDIENLTTQIFSEGAQAIVDILSPQLNKSQANLLLLVDQFEEIFRFGLQSKKKQTTEEAANFVAIILELAAQRDIPLYVTITMRSDFLGDCDKFYGLPEAMNRSQYLVPRLTREQRREAIEGPIHLYGGRINPRLTDRLLNEADETFDDLPILQHALMRTWDAWHRNGKGDIDSRQYEEINTMENALSSHAEEALLDMDEEQKLLTKRLFQSLTETDPSNRRIRRPAKLNDVAARNKTDPSKIWEIVQKFRSEGRSFLVVSSENIDDNPLIDISHESLIRQWQQLQEWVDQEALSVKTYLRLAQTTELHGQGHALYYRGAELRMALDWLENEKPNRDWAKRFDLGLMEQFNDSIKFLEKSKKREKRRKFTFIFIPVLALFSYAFVATIFWYDAKESEYIAKRAEVEALDAKFTAIEERAFSDSMRNVIQNNLDSLNVLLVQLAQEENRAASAIQRMQKEKARADSLQALYTSQKVQEQRTEDTSIVTLDSTVSYRLLYQIPELDQNELQPSKKLLLAGTSKQRKVINVWNNYGNLLMLISNSKKISVGVAIAVLCVESSSKGFNSDGRMIVRFENHQFWKRWGKNNPDKFNVHFKYQASKVWLGHKWRPTEQYEWQTFHGNQNKEWQVLEFARTLDDTAALDSTSMGAPQLYGFNYKILGYKSPQEMFKKFKSDIRFHIIALFDFFDRRMIKALQEKEFKTFASYYNGSGQSEKYGSWLIDHYIVFQALNIQHQLTAVQGQKLVLNKGRVTPTILNVRNRPGLNAMIIGTLPENSMVEIIDKLEDYFEIIFNGSIGFVHSTYIKTLVEK